MMEINKKHYKSAFDREMRLNAITSLRGATVQNICKYLIYFFFDQTPHIFLKVMIIHDFNVKNDQKIYEIRSEHAALRLILDPCYVTR